MTASGGGGQYDLGGAVLRLYGDRSALDRELELLKRYTDQLENRGIKVKFDANTGNATRELNAVQQRLRDVAESLGSVNDAMRGGEAGWSALAGRMRGLGEAAAAGGGSIGAFGGAASLMASGVMKAIPVLGQLGLAAEGVQVIFQAVSGAINGVLRPLQQLASETGRFNQQVAEAGIFIANSFAVFGPDGKIVEGTAAQMRALRGVVTTEFLKIQKEVATISGATSSEVFEGFNIILQNASSLGEKGQQLENISKLALRTAAAMNTLNIPGFQLRTELSSLVTGNVQAYDILANKLYGSGAGEKIRQLQAEGRYYDDLMQKLNKLYEGQKVLALSLQNVQSNYADVFQTIAAQAGVALERGLARMLQSVLTPLTNLQESATILGRTWAEALEPVLRVFGQLGASLTSLLSMLASLGSVAGNLVTLTTSSLGTVVLPALEAVARTLEWMAKNGELLAKAFDLVMRPLLAINRIQGELNTQRVDSFFDTAIAKSDQLGKKLDELGLKFAKPGRDLATFLATRMVEGATVYDTEQKRERPLTAKEKRERIQAVQAAYDQQTGTYPKVTISSSTLDMKTQGILDELKSRYGDSDSSKRLQQAKELAQIKADTYKNELNALENGLRLMQAQKTIQEAMAGLADARRRMALTGAQFSTQLAVSPEARLNAGDRVNELTAQQERERLQERARLLNTERDILRQQLQIQERQAAIQRENLRVQLLEIQIQRDKLSGVGGAAEKVQLQIQALERGGVSPSDQRLVQRRGELAQINREVDLRNQQLGVIRRQLELNQEGLEIGRQINGIEERRLGIQEQTLGVQGQIVGLNLQQQQQLSALQRREQELQNETAARKKVLQERLAPLEAELKALQQQQESNARLQQLEQARGELAKARAANEVRAAEGTLKLAQLQEAAGRGKAGDFIAMQIEQLATGQKGQVTVVDATRRLYEARQRQLAVEQEQQQRALRIQQEREMSERRIAILQLQVQLGQAKLQEIELRGARARLALSMERDQLSGTVTGAGSLMATGQIVGYTGGGQNDATRGRSSGPHLHAQGGPNAATLRQWVDAALDFGGQTASQVSRKVGGGLGRGDFGPGGHGYSGQDYYMNQGTPFSLRPGWSARSLGVRGALGLGMEVSGPNGESFQLGHLERVVSTAVSATARALQRAPEPRAVGPAGGTSIDATGAQRMDRFLNYLAFIESGFNNGAQNRSSGAIGRFQFTADTLTDAKDRYGIDPNDIRSSDFARQKRAVAEFIRKDALDAYKAIIEGNTPLAEQLLLRRWPSLRGGDQAATGSRLQQGLAYLNGAPAPIPGAITAGRQSLTGSILATGGIPDSMQNQAEQNTQALQENSSVQGQLEAAIKELINWTKQLSELFGTQRETLNEQQSGERNALAIDSRRAQLEAAINADPRVRYARDQADLISGGLGNVVRTGVMGLASGNTAGLKEALAGALADLGSRLLENTLNALLEPLMSQLTGSLVNLMAGPRIQEIAAAQGLSNAAVGQQTAATGLLSSATALSTAAAALTGTGGLKSIGALGGIASLFGGGGLGSLVPGLSGIPNFSSLLPNIGFNPLAFSGAFATGGDLDWGRGALVGENGPELIFPQRPMSVFSADRSSTILSKTRQALEQSRLERAGSGTATPVELPSNRPIPIDSRVINQVEYVTMDQARELADRAEQRGARRGQAMAYQGMRQDLQVRRQLGMG